MDMEKEVGDLKEDFTELKFKVRDLDFHYNRLNEEVKSINNTLARFENNFNQTREDMVEIVKDASTRVPKWLMGFTYAVLVVLVLAVSGWGVIAILNHH